MNEPKLQRTNDEGWKPATFKDTWKLWVILLLGMAGICWSGWEVLRFMFGWL